MMDNSSSSGTDAAWRGGQTDSSKNNNNTRQGGCSKLNHNSNKSKKSRGEAKSTKFKGRLADLKGCIFDCFEPTQGNRHVTTKREIEEYTGHTYKYGADTMWALENNKVFQAKILNDPVEIASLTQNLLWQKTIELHYAALRPTIKWFKNICWKYCV